jgi:hypothetical protein
MIILPSETLVLIWIGWLISWVAASFWSSLMQRRVATLVTCTYGAPIMAGCLWFLPFTAWVLGQR